MSTDSLRALVIDDDPIHLEIARTLLLKRGFQVRVAADARSLGPEDLNVAVLLLDLNMPEFDGVEVLERLHGLDFRGGLVIVSGATKSVRNAASGLASAFGLLLLGQIEKPLNAAKLDAVLGLKPGPLPGKPSA